jgi:hypothetical protein
MNERINELLKQSRTEYWTQYTPSYDYEKFAELIVQDSIEQILEWKNEPFPFDEHTAVWILKKHFGVE